MSAEDTTAVSSTSTKQQADEAVARGEWDLARTLYLQGLRELPDDNEYNELHAKLHANTSFVCLKLNRFEDAQSHGDHAVALAPNWGKAYARLGAAQQAAGLLLDAAESYRASLAAEESFDGCKNAYKKLKQSKRFCKLELIRRASSEAEKQPLQVRNRIGQVIQIPNEANNPFNAVAAMNDQQKETLARIRAGCVLPDGSPMEKVKEQDLILYLAALDASILLHTTPGKRDVLLCPGTRAWIISHAREEMDGGDIGGSVTFDIYKELLHGKEGEYEMFWKHDDTPSSYRANTILFCPNRTCDDSSMWGPTVKFMDYRLGKFPDDGRTLMAEATFLVGLNYWLLVQAGTDAIPLDWDLLNGAFSWDVAQQRLVDNNAKHFNPRKFYGVAGLLGGYFSVGWGGEVDVSKVLFYYQDF